MFIIPYIKVYSIFMFFVIFIGDKTIFCYE